MTIKRKEQLKQYAHEHSQSMSSVIDKALELLGIAANWKPNAKSEDYKLRTGRAKFSIPKENKDNMPFI